MKILYYTSDDNIIYQLTINGTYMSTTFKLTDICTILSIPYKKHLFRDYLDDEKINIRASRSFSSFLTIKGVLKIISNQSLHIVKIKHFYDWFNLYVESLKVSSETPDAHLERTKDEARKIEKTKHDILIEKSKRTSQLYLTKVKNIDDTSFVIKFGVTADLKQRIAAHAKDFGMCILLDTFVIPAALELERSIKNDVHLKSNFYAESINGKKSTEVILIDDKLPYETFHEIVKKRSRDFMDYTEKEKHEFKKEENKSAIIKLLSDFRTITFANETERSEYFALIKKLVEEHVDESVDKSIDESNDEPIDEPTEDTHEPEITTPHVGPKKRKASRGNKIQQYDPVDHTKIIATYEGFTDAARHIPTASANGIESACDNKTIYKGYRWFEISRDTPDNTIFDIGKTAENIQQYKGYIALINYDADKILTVYANQKIAGEVLRLSASSIAAAIKRGSRCSGGHLMKYDDLPDCMKTEYLKSNKLPDAFEIKGVKINQIDPATKNVIKSWNNVNAVIRAMAVSRSTLFDACEHGHTVKGFLWSKV